MEWKTPSASALAARTKAIAGVLLDRAVAPPTPITAGVWHLPFAAEPTLYAKYRHKFDELLLKRAELAATPLNPQPSKDIGPVQAKTAMMAVFQGLAARGVIDPMDYDLQDVKTSHARSGSGPIGSPPTKEWIDEYRFRLVRSVNGVLVANAGLIIGIHPTGVASSIRIGGVHLWSQRSPANVEEPTPPGSIGKRTVPQTAIDARFQSEIPQGSSARVHWHQVLYAMPDGVTSAIVEPLYVYSFSVVTPTSVGQPVVSRRRVLGFSLTDAGAAPVELAGKHARPDPQPPKIVP